MELAITRSGCTNRHIEEPSHVHHLWRRTWPTSQTDEADRWIKTHVTSVRVIQCFLFYFEVLLFMSCQVLPLRYVWLFPLPNVSHRSPIVYLSHVYLTPCSLPPVPVCVISSWAVQRFSPCELFVFWSSFLFSDYPHLPDPYLYLYLNWIPGFDDYK